MINTHFPTATRQSELGLFDTMYNVITSESSTIGCLTGSQTLGSYLEERPFPNEFANMVPGADSSVHPYVWRMLPHRTNALGQYAWSQIQLPESISVDYDLIGSLRDPAEPNKYNPCRLDGKYVGLHKPSRKILAFCVEYERCCEEWTHDDTLAVTIMAGRARQRVFGELILGLRSHLSTNPSRISATYGYLETRRNTRRVEQQRIWAENMRFAQKISKYKHEQSRMQYDVSDDSAA